MDPDPGCPKTCESCESGSGYPTLHKTIILNLFQLILKCFFLIVEKIGGKIFVLFFIQITVLKFSYGRSRDASTLYSSMGLKSPAA
jgi:hypothetical protein